MAQLLALARRRAVASSAAFGGPILALRGASFCALPIRTAESTTSFHTSASASRLPIPPPRGGRAPPAAKVDRRKAGNGSASDPFFREVWRRFQLKVHPDLFTKFPELQKANAESLQKLQGLLNECKSGQGRCTSDILQARTETVEFYLRTERDNAFTRVPMAFRIPGGNCRNVVGASFSELFRIAGLPERFRWGTEYWESTYIKPAKQAEEEDD